MFFARAIFLGAVQFEQLNDRSCAFTCKSDMHACCISGNRYGSHSAHEPAFAGHNVPIAVNRLSLSHPFTRRPAEPSRPPIELGDSVGLASRSDELLVRELLGHDLVKQPVSDT